MMPIFNREKYILKSRGISHIFMLPSKAIIFYWYQKAVLENALLQHKKRTPRN